MNGLRSTSFALLAALLGACATLPPPVWPGTAEGEALARAWFESSQGFDAYEVYELRGTGTAVRFALARRHDAGSVQVRSEVLAPKTFRGTGLLLRLSPGKKPRLLAAAPRSTVAETLNPAFLPASGASWSVAAEVALPLLPEVFLHRRLPDEVVHGEPCSVLESRPVEKQRGFTTIVRKISQRTGVALQIEYYRGRYLARTVSVLPKDVQETEGRFLPRVRSVWSADGTRSEIVLHRAVLDVDLPERVFTERGLVTGSFPKL